MTEGVYEKGEEGLVVASFTKFEHATVGLLYLLFCVVGVSSNLVTALTFYKDVKLLTNCKPWLHICLALANVGVVAPSPFPASSSFSGRWLYGSTMCQMYAFEGMFVGIVAIGSVIALCMERYHVANKANKRGENTSWFYGWSLIFVIGNGLFWATMPLLGWSRYTVEHTGTSCAIDWKNPDESYVSYIITLQIFSFGLPMLIGCLCLYSAHTQQPVQSVAGVSGASQSHDSSQGQMTPDQATGGLSEDQLLSLCYVFILMVLVGWGPFAFLCTYSMVGGAQGASMLASCIPPLACKLMVSGYPLAYAVTSPRFRHSFKAILTGGDRKQD